MGYRRFFVFKKGIIVVRPEILLPHPAEYFPLQNGRYSVSPSLHRLGTDFGNGIADACLLQFDERFPRFRQNKLRCRAECFSKYVCEANLRPEVREAVTELLRERLAGEYPSLFSRAVQSDKSSTLHCRLTGETLFFDPQNRLTAVSGADSTLPPYADAMDALACQFPEDIAVVCRDAASGEDWLAKLHLCAPSHWAAADKIGTSWAVTHAPVPGMERSRSAASSLVRVMIEREPTVRFTWGIEFDDRLNHHPQPPPDTEAAVWNRRRRDPACREPFFLRVERQVIWGLPAVNAAIFTIRIYHTPASALLSDSERRSALHSALLSMSTESVVYKGLTGCLDEVLASVAGSEICL